MLERVADLESLQREEVLDSGIRVLLSRCTLERDPWCAVCALDVAGVGRDPDAGGPARNCGPTLCPGRLASVLPAGGALTFLFTNGVANESGSTRWRILAETRAPTASGAREAALDLVYGVTSWLSVAKARIAYQSALDHGRPGWDDRWSYRSCLPAPAVACRVNARRPAGFSGEPPAAPTMLLRLNTEQSGGRPWFFEPVLSVLEQARSAAALSVRLEGRPLTSAELAAVREFDRRWRDGTADHWQAGGWTRLRQGDSEVGAISDALAVWAGSPSALALSVSLLTEQPPQQGLRRMVEHELYRFAGNQCGWRDGAVDGADQQCRVLDLSHRVHENDLLTWTLPSADYWRRSGLPIAGDLAPEPLPAPGVVVGTCRVGLLARRVSIADADRSSHVYICGATGTGKSTLLRNMVLQDIDAGHGVCVIDPHGDLFEEVGASIPAHREGDVIVVDPQDREWAVGVNLLDRDLAAGAPPLHFLASELLKIFDQLYNMREVGGPMFELYMRNALLLAAANNLGRATIMDVQAIFEDPRFRAYLKEHCDDPLVVSFWNQMAERVGGEASLTNMGPYVSSKLNAMTCNAAVRCIIGQSRSTIDFQSAMDRQAIVLVNLTQGALGELDSRLLGMLITTRIFAAAMARAGRPRAQRRPFHLYIDEFQAFTTDTIASMLAGARKYGLFLTLANQNLSQLLAGHGRQNMLDSVLANCGSLVCFRLALSDAQRMESYTLPALKAGDLQQLPNYHAAVRLLSGGAPMPPCVVSTEPPAGAGCAGRWDAIRQASRTKYARPVSEVESEIRRWRFASHGPSEERNDSLFDAFEPLPAQ